MPQSSNREKRQSSTGNRAERAAGCVWQSGIIAWHTRSRAERRDFLQNVTIALLSVSALLLFSRTEMFRMARDAAEDTFLLPAELGIPSRTEGDVSLSAPVRLAVTSSYVGRFGALFLTTDAPSFQPVRAILAEALADRDHPLAEAQRADFLRSLNGVSLYCDFLRPLPLSLLAGYADADCQEDAQARCVAAVEEGSGTALYLWDGGDQYWRRDTPVTRQALVKAAGQYRTENASFGMDYSDAEGSRYHALSSLTLLPAKTPSLPMLSASGTSAGTDALLTALRFNPLTNSRYPEPNGTEVVVEGARTIRIRANGSIYYQGGGQEDLRIESAGEVPTPREAAAGCLALLQSLLGSGGKGAMYPREVRQEGRRTVLLFDYQFSGVPIRFPNGRAGAEVVLDGRSVASLELLPRQYTAAEWESLLLPLPQALAIAALHPGAELTVGYADNGSGQISACWMAD